MATKTKRKAALRAASAKAGRRAPVRVKTSRDVLLLPIAVAAVLVALAIGLIVYAIANRNQTSSAPTVAGIPCDALQHSQVHYHAAIQIMYQGNVVHIPANIGIQGDPAAPTCYYWLHVHTANPDVIHIESPASQTFTLGNFFSVWNTWAKSSGRPAALLDSTHVASFTLTADQKLVVYVDPNDGNGPKLFTGDPKTILLKAHEVIWLEISPPTVSPPPTFTFASSL